MRMRSAVLLACTVLCPSTSAVGQSLAPTPTRVEVPSGDWVLIGDLTLPEGTGPQPAVLLLNQADGDRGVYRELAGALAEAGLASLALDLRGHGESTNRGTFVPGEVRRDPLIWESQPDVTAALAYLRSHDRIDGGRLGVVGASYSGEEAAEAGRLDGYAAAYALLSPGSFGDTSIAAIDSSGVPWLLVAAREDRFLTEIVASAMAESATIEIVHLPGRTHATNLLAERPDLVKRLVAWFELQLR